jgi:rhodanese-related sulfurtransferase
MTSRHILAGIAAALAVLAAVTGMPRATPSGAVDAALLAREIQHEDDHVTALELAQWIRERRPGLRVLDVRSDSEFTAYHVPSAERVPLDSLVAMKSSGSETLVLYSEGGAHAAQGWVLLKTLGFKRVYFLRGGLLEWMDDVMSPVVAAGDTTTGALSRYFGGTPRLVIPGEPAGRVEGPARGSSAGAVAKLRRRGC